MGAARAKHLKITRPSKRQSVASRSFNSKLMKTTKTRTVCLNWPTSFNKSLRRPRRDPKWLELSSLLLVLVQLICKHILWRLVQTPCCILQARYSISQITFDVPHKLYLNKQQQIFHRPFDIIFFAIAAQGHILFVDISC